jgi:hypothetical protein
VPFRQLCDRLADVPWQISTVRGSSRAVCRFVADFRSCLQQERGLSPSSISTWSGCVLRFLASYLLLNRPLSEIRIEDVEAYFAVKRDLWKRKTVVCCANALRVFFPEPAFFSSRYMDSEVEKSYSFVWVISTGETEPFGLAL